MRLKFESVLHLQLLSIFLLLGLPLFADSIQERFNTPSGYRRIETSATSFESYLRNYPLKEKGAPVLLYDGSKKRNLIHAAVLEFPLLKQDLIQCADAIIKLRTEYLFKTKRHNEIQFKISNGMIVPFSEFSKGKRVQIKGNKSTWTEPKFKKGVSKEILEEYLRFIYSYAGTASLVTELKQKNTQDLQIGDIFIQGGSPGHAVIVVDLAVNEKGEKVFLLAQSYMPSQEMHILKNFSANSPWFSVPIDSFETPEWVFPKNSLRSFID